MHRYKSVRDQETVAFIAANMAFGQRVQILSHIEQILAQTNCPSQWVQKEGYRDFLHKEISHFTECIHTTTL